MKCVWEVDDIDLGRMAFSRSRAKSDICIAYSKANGCGYGVCHVGSDGLFIDLGEKESVAEYLNRHGYLPVELREKP